MISHAITYSSNIILSYVIRRGIRAVSLCAATVCWLRARQQAGQRPAAAAALRSDSLPPALVLRGSFLRLVLISPCTV